MCTMVFFTFAKLHHRHQIFLPRPLLVRSSFRSYSFFVASTHSTTAPSLGAAIINEERLALCSRVPLYLSAFPPALTMFFAAAEAGPLVGEEQATTSAGRRGVTSVRRVIGRRCVTSCPSRHCTLYTRRTHPISAHPIPSHPACRGATENQGRVRDEDIGARGGSKVWPIRCVPRSSSLLPRSRALHSIVPSFLLFLFVGESECTNAHVQGPGPRSSDSSLVYKSAPLLVRATTIKTN
jgi:hypothetical protein